MVTRRRKTGAKEVPGRDLSALHLVCSRTESFKAVPYRTGNQLQLRGDRFHT